MLERLKIAVQTLARRSLDGLAAARVALLLLVVLGAAGYALYRHPPFKSVARGEVGVRVNRITSEVSEWRDTSVFVLPGLHEVRVFSLRDRTYRPTQSSRADGPAPLQSLEGLSLGVDLTVRYALDPARVRAVANNLPEDIAGDMSIPRCRG